jgi:hypothetical protein
MLYIFSPSKPNTVSIDLAILLSLLFIGLLYNPTKTVSIESAVSALNNSPTSESMLNIKTRLLIISLSSVRESIELNSSTFPSLKRILLRSVEARTNVE